MLKQRRPLGLRCFFRICSVAFSANNAAEGGHTTLSGDTLDGKRSRRVLGDTFG